MKGNTTILLSYLLPIMEIIAVNTAFLQRIALLQISLSYPNGHALAGSDYHRDERNIGKYISLADFAPSILDICGIEYDENSYSGRSFVPLIQGDQKIANWKDEMCTQTNGNELYGIQRSNHDTQVEICL